MKQAELIKLVHRLEAVQGKRARLEATRQASVETMKELTAAGATAAAEAERLNSRAIALRSAGADEEAIDGVTVASDVARSKAAEARQAIASANEESASIQTQSTALGVEQAALRETLDTELRGLTAEECAPRVTAFRDGLVDALVQAVEACSAAWQKELADTAGVRRLWVAINHRTRWPDELDIENATSRVLVSVATAAAGRLNAQRAQAG